MIKVLKQELQRLQTSFRNAQDVTGVIANAGTGTGTCTYAYVHNSGCPKCGDEMKVQKTTLRIRSIITLNYGKLTVRETFLTCKSSCKHPSGHLVTQRSEELAAIAAPGSNYAYDVEVFVGLQRYLYYQQRKEIQQKLKSEYGIVISTGEISYLTRRFIEHFEALHTSSSENLKKALVPGN